MQTCTAVYVIYVSHVYIFCLERPPDTFLKSMFFYLVLPVQHTDDLLCSPPLSDIFTGECLSTFTRIKCVCVLWFVGFSLDVLIIHLFLLSLETRRNMETSSVFATESAALLSVCVLLPGGFMSPDDC